MTLGAFLFHLFSILAVIAVVVATIRKDTPRAVVLSAVRFFLTTVAVMAGISAVLYILIQI